MKELERLLDMAYYYSKFVSRFAELASPLQDLKNSGQFQWSSRFADTFRTVKAAILHSFLAVPDFNQEFVLETDAIGMAIAGVLTQHGRPVAVACKRLSTAEQSWSAAELEALAIVYCASKFRQFLLGRPFFLYTEQRALSFLFSSSVKSTCKNNQLIKWQTELSEYNFRIAYKPGKENLGEDAFSRAFALQSVKSLFTIELFRQAQEEDNALSTLRSSLESQLRPAVVSLGLWSNRKRLQVLQGVLCLVESGNV